MVNFIEEFLLWKHLRYINQHCKEKIKKIYFTY